MSKPNRSDMTPSDFVYIVGLLGGEYQKVGELIGRSAPMISQYASGARPITKEVERLLRDAVKERKARLGQVEHALHGKLIDTDEQLLEANHRLRLERAQFTTRQPQLPHRMQKEDARTFPAYRMDYAKFALYLRALNAWAARIRKALKESSNPIQLRGYQLELADLKALAEYARGAIQRGTPYDVCITRTEWNVVSRALRYLFKTERVDAAYAIYEHWRIHKGCGYPRNRPS